MLGSSKSALQSGDKSDGARSLMDRMLPALYLGLNIASAVLVVFANKLVMTTLGFHFTYCLTFIHSATTIGGMALFAAWGLYEKKQLSVQAYAPLALAYVAYIVLSNLNLKVNSVAFYSVCKIAVAPIVMAMEFFLFQKVPTPKIIASVVVVCVGVAVSTVTDFSSAMSTGLIGFLIGVGASMSTSLYQIWAGSKQRELNANSSQLLQQYCPLATVMLGVLVLTLEPLGFQNPGPDTILGYNYTWGATAAIFISAVLGLFVSLSTFLAIGATSSLTYNIVGHIKTAFVLAGGKLFFGEEMPLKKLAGIMVAVVGIVWYSQLKMSEGAKRPPPPPVGSTADAESKPLLEEKK